MAMEKSNFDQLLERYLTGKTSEEETRKIEAWLDVIKTENSAELTLSKEEEEKLFGKIVGRIDSNDSQLPTGKSKTANTWILKMAASVVILLSLSFLLWNLLGNPATNMDKMILNDGTLVWLHEKSQLSYYEKPGDQVRYAELTGEALFEVAKDSSRLFMITCGDINIKVLGTSFGVKTWPDSLELTVLTGLVNLSSTTDSIGVNIQPNQKVVYTSKGKLKKSDATNSDVSLITANTEYDMKFVNSTLDNVVKKIEDKFNVKVTIENENAGKCHITADLTDQSLASTLQLISEALDVTYSKKDNQVTITGSGCK